MRTGVEVGWGGAQAEPRRPWRGGLLHPRLPGSAPFPYALTQPSGLGATEAGSSCLHGQVEVADAKDSDVISGGLGVEPPLKRDRKWLAKAEHRSPGPPLVLTDHPWPSPEWRCPPAGCLSNSAGAWPAAFRACPRGWFPRSGGEEPSNART